MRLRCTAGDWDWQLWADVSGINPAGIAIRHAFDTDDAALHAAVAGLGMVLALPLLTRREVQAGTLVPVPGFEPGALGHHERLWCHSRHEISQVLHGRLAPMNIPFRLGTAAFWWARTAPLQSFGATRTWKIHPGLHSERMLTGDFRSCYDL